MKYISVTILQFFKNSPNGLDPIQQSKNLHVMNMLYNRNNNDPTTT